MSLKGKIPLDRDFGLKKPHTKIVELMVEDQVSDLHQHCLKMIDSRSRDEKFLNELLDWLKEHLPNQ